MTNITKDEVVSCIQLMERLRTAVITGMGISGADRQDVDYFKSRVKEVVDLLTKLLSLNTNVTIDDNTEDNDDR